MTEQRKRTPTEIWLALERMTEEVELERIDALTDEELDREVRAAGIDPRALDAVVAATILVEYEELPQGRSERVRRRGAPAARGAPARRSWRWLAWLLVAGAAIALVVALAGRRDPVARVPPSTPAAGAPRAGVTASPAPNTPPLSVH